MDRTATQAHTTRRHSGPAAAAPTDSTRQTPNSRHSCRRRPRRQRRRTQPARRRPVGIHAGGAYGDNIGGMTIAGGVAAALYGRHVTGEPSVLDVSLLAVGGWTTQFSVNMAMLIGGPLPKIERQTQAPGNPLTGAYRTADGRFVQLSMLQ